MAGLFRLFALTRRKREEEENLKIFQTCHERYRAKLEAQENPKTCGSWRFTVDLEDNFWNECTSCGGKTMNADHRPPSSYECPFCGARTEIRLEDSV